MSSSLSNLVISTTAASLSNLVFITPITNTLSAASATASSSASVTFLTILAPTPTVPITRPGIATASLHHTPLPQPSTPAVSVASSNYSTVTGNIKEGPTSVSLVMSRTPVVSVVSAQTPVPDNIMSNSASAAYRYPSIGLPSVVFLAWVAHFIFPHH